MFCLGGANKNQILYIFPDENMITFIYLLNHLVQEINLHKIVVPIFDDSVRENCD